MLWGAPLPIRKVVHPPAGEPLGPKQAMYRVLMRNLPAGQKFQVKIGLTNDIDNPGISPASEFSATRKEVIHPDFARNVMVHRTDPRINLAKHDGSVCVDVHWAHPHPRLDFHPDDVYFRVSHQYVGEHPDKFCEDQVGETVRSCGVPIDMVNSDYPAAYSTICGLRPKRHVSFNVDVFNCDNESGTVSVRMMTPPSSPSVVTTMVTEAGAQEAIAGFRPTCALDWIPQHDDLIEGHAVYLGLRDIATLKLLCWIPHDHSAYSAGHLDIPIKHKNHTFSEDAQLLRDYEASYHVHQEQELWVSTRTKGHLESPAFVHRLGEWLVMDDALKCLTSFESSFPSYVSFPVKLFWTQAEAMSLYD
jgi:hypothetical protein